MKKLLLLSTVIAISLAACGRNSSETPASQAPAPQSPAAGSAVTLPPNHPAFGGNNMGQAAPLPPLTQKAVVLSAINVTQYTYLEVKQDNNTRWLATTTSPAKAGDTIQFDDGMTMTNFNSKMLNRVFPSITFVGRVVISGEKS
jgi:ABC-type Fe3+-hydroxamate transport system substrate-binding protein